MKKQFVEKETPGYEFPLGGMDLFHSSPAGCRTILLISSDKWFHENLRSFANTFGLWVVRLEGKAGTVAVMQATKPVAVLLDLDLPRHAAWAVAELLFNELSCPEVILLTGRTERFELRTALQAGALVGKDESPCRLLEIVEEALERPQVNQAERNAIQRLLIRWLRGSEWAEETTAEHRFWGINE
jgi:DNA-binding response OmpR family regulator